MRRALVFLTTSILTAAPAAGETTRAKQAILVEHSTGRVLFEKGADTPMAPSSMTKLMTLFLASEGMKEGRAGENAMVKIAQRAAACAVEHNLSP